MARAYFLHQIKHKTNGTWDKGIVVKDAFETDKENYEAAKQSYHAYLGAYAYKNSAETDFVSCAVTDETGARLMWETWEGRAPDPGPEPEPETPEEAAADGEADNTPDADTEGQEAE